MSDSTKNGEIKQFPVSASINTVAQALASEDTLSPEQARTYHYQALKFYRSGWMRHAGEVSFWDYMRASWNWSSFWFGVGSWGLINFSLIGGWRLVKYLTGLL